MYTLPDGMHLEENLPVETIRVQIQGFGGRVEFKTQYDPSTGTIQRKNGQWRPLSKSDVIVRYFDESAGKWYPWHDAD